MSMAETRDPLPLVNRAIMAAQSQPGCAGGRPRPEPKRDIKLPPISDLIAVLHDGSGTGLDPAGEGLGVRGMPRNTSSIIFPMSPTACPDDGWSPLPRTEVLLPKSQPRVLPPIHELEVHSRWPDPSRSPGSRAAQKNAKEDYLTSRVNYHGVSKHGGCKQRDSAAPRFGCRAGILPVRQLPSSSPILDSSPSPRKHKRKPANRRSTTHSNKQYDTEQIDYIRYLAADLNVPWEDIVAEYNKYWGSKVDHPERGRQGLQGVHYRGNHSVPAFSRDDMLILDANGEPELWTLMIRKNKDSIKTQQKKTNRLKLTCLYPERALRYSWVSADDKKVALENIVKYDAQKRLHREMMAMGRPLPYHVPDVEYQAPEKTASYHPDKNYEWLG